MYVCLPYNSWLNLDNVGEVESNGNKEDKNERADEDWDDKKRQREAEIKIQIQHTRLSKQ